MCNVLSKLDLFVSVIKTFTNKSIFLLKGGLVKHEVCK